jgi:aspartate/methionine/tyrosine aminotransferase
MHRSDNTVTRIRPEVLNVAESPMVVIATEAERTPGSLKLCYGESDMVTPEFICRAAHEELLAGHTFYKHPAGYPELREAIARKVYELHGVGYQASEIMSTVGATMAIHASIRWCVGPGDNAVVITPTYAIFTNGVILAGGEPRTAPLARAGAGFQLDLDRLRAAIDDHTRLIIVNSPSNPTGWMITEDEQRALYQLADHHGVTILSDEVYERLVFDGSEIAPSFARILHDPDLLIVVNSFSKTYNMTGWRLGWAQSSQRVIGQMAKAVEFMTSNAAAMTQQAGIVALRDGEPYVHEVRADYEARRAQVVAALSDLPGVELPPPQGAFYAFPRVKGLTDSAAFALNLLRETGVALAPGSAFGEGGEGHIRICFAASEATLASALERVRSFSGWGGME